MRAIALAMREAGVSSVQVTDSETGRTWPLALVTAERAAGLTPVAATKPAHAMPARAAYASARPSRVCSYCGRRTSSAMCCGDETMPA
jgi:hypothetical protein